MSKRHNGEFLIRLFRSVLRPLIRLRAPGGAKLLFLLAALVVACGNSPQSADEQLQSILPPDLQQADLALVGSADQLQPLLDGELVYSEYERAFWALIACFEEAGLQVGPEPSIDANGTVNYRLLGGANLEQVAAVLETSRVCEFQHWSILNRVWVWQTRITEAERNEARRYISECLREFGIGTSDIPSDAELSVVAESEFESLSACATRAEEQTGIRGF